MATPTASIAWEKRSNADGETFQSATFTVGGTAGPFACAGDPTNPVTVVDDATNDSDPLLGRYLLAGVCPGTYTVTETVPPPGAAVDPDPTREVTVSDGEAEFIGIPGEADDCPDEFPALDTSADDFCDPQLGSMAWEKRNQADEETFQSATFTVGGDTGPFACTGDPTNPVTVGDDADGIPGGGNDADPLVGRYLLDGVCPGTYTVTETVGPPGMGLESDATRVVTVADGEADSIGIPGEADECPDPEPANDTDEADYCDGASIAWEKRSQADEENFQSATFTVGGETGPFSCAGDPTNPVTVEDNSTNDIHPLVGVYVLAGVCPGTYTVTETVPPPGAVVDPDPTREGTVAEGEAASVGTMGESDDCPDATPATDADEADFCDPQLGSIAWEKRNQADAENFQSATFTVGGDTGPFACTGDPTNPVTVGDDADGIPGDGNDANPFIGQYLLDGVCPGTYTVTETVPPAGMVVDPDPSRVVTVADGEAASIGTPLEADDCPDPEPANDSEDADFCNLPESAVTFPESAVTNSAGCAFDAFEPEDGLQHFKLIFTPDPNNVPYYKLTASNPGQFLFNVVYEGSPGDVVTFDVELPYPFVTQGAMPIHVYESVFVLDDCFVAGTPISASSQGVTLADYGGTFGSTETMSIGPITAGPTGLVYVTIHLDHGLEGFRNYEKVPFSNSAKSPGNSALPASPQPIDDMGAYAFSVSGAVSDVQTIHNANVFKHDPGFAGLVTDVFGNPLAGVLVHVRGPDGSLVAAVSTDADGYWSYAYKHKGKAATFTVGLPAYGVEVAVPVKANSFVWVDLVVPP